MDINNLMLIITGILILFGFSVAAWSVLGGGHNESKKSIEDYKFSDDDIKKTTITFDGNIALSIELSPNEEYIFLRERDVAVMARHYGMVK